MWNDCGNALVITTCAICAMRHAILTAEKNVWIQWISEQPGKNNNFGQLAYVKPFAPFRLCLTRNSLSEVDRSQYYKEAEHPDYKYSPKTGRQTSPPPGAQCWKVITCRVVGWRLEWRTSFFGGSNVYLSGIAISSLRWRSFQAGNC